MPLGKLRHVTRLRSVWLACRRFEASAWQFGGPATVRSRIEIIFVQRSEKSRNNINPVYCTVVQTTRILRLESAGPEPSTVDTVCAARTSSSIRPSILSFLHPSIRPPSLHQSKLPQHDSHRSAPPRRDQNPSVVESETAASELLQPRLELVADLVGCAFVLENKNKCQ